MPLDREPEAAGENHSMHSKKYAFEEAVGDLIDNAIDADATEINLWFQDQSYDDAGSIPGQGKHVLNYPEGLPYLDGKHLFVLLEDNGNGMSVEQLDNAVKYGKRRPYKEFELGYFGVGMKNSAMSQSYETTILTKQEGIKTVYRISSVHIQNTNKDQILLESDFSGNYSWMKNTLGYEKATKTLKSKTLLSERTP